MDVSSSQKKLTNMFVSCILKCKRMQEMGIFNLLNEIKEEVFKTTDVGIKASVKEEIRQKLLFRLKTLKEKNNLISRIKMEITWHDTI